MGSKPHDEKVALTLVPASETKIEQKRYYSFIHPLSTKPVGTNQHNFRQRKNYKKLGKK